MLAIPSYSKHGPLCRLFSEIVLDEINSDQIAAEDSTNDELSEISQMDRMNTFDLKESFTEKLMTELKDELKELRKNFIDGIQSQQIFVLVWSVLERSNQR